MIGPVTLHFLEAYFLRHNSSLDAMITNLQVSIPIYSIWLALGANGISLY